MSNIRCIRTILTSLRLFRNGYRSSSTITADVLLPSAGPSAPTLIDMVNFYSKGMPLPQPTVFHYKSFSAVPIQVCRIKPYSRDHFASAGVVTYLADLEMHLKQPDRCGAQIVDLHDSCAAFYGLTKLNEICHNQIVVTCGLEKIVNLLKIILECPEKPGSSKSLELLCHGVMKLRAASPSQETKLRLKTLLKLVVPQLLKRISAFDYRIDEENSLCRALNRFARGIDYEFEESEKDIIALVMTNMLERATAKSQIRSIFYTLFDVSEMFCMLEIREENGSFQWFNKFVKTWTDVAQNNRVHDGLLKMMLHLNFVLIGLKNGKYDVVYDRKGLWSKILQERKSVMTEGKTECLKKCVKEMPPGNETCKKLLDLLNPFLQ